MTDWPNNIHVGDCRALMREMAADGVRVNCVVSSPPYWGLRDYGVDGQYGLESTLEEWVKRITDVFDHVKTLLADDGTLWLNLGDSYCSGGRGGNSTAPTSTLQGSRDSQAASMVKREMKPPAGLKPKDMAGQPWRIAFALQAAGWYLRSDIIWHKPNPMPESTKDRPTKAHEYVFLMAKSERYHYDATAIAEPVTGNAHARGDGVNPKARNKVSGWASGDTPHDAISHAQPKKQDGHGRRHAKFNERWKNKQNESFGAAVNELVDTRNARSVWQIGTEPTSFAHFACFPRELVRRCILAGSKPGDIVFDPFMGSGTVAEVALSLGRQYIGTELNPEYAGIFRAHRSQQQGMAI